MVRDGHEGFGSCKFQSKRVSNLRISVDPHSRVEFRVEFECTCREFQSVETSQSFSYGVCMF